MKREIHTHRQNLWVYIGGRERGRDVTHVPLKKNIALVIGPAFIAKENKGEKEVIYGVDTDWWTVTIMGRSTIARAREIDIVFTEGGTTVRIAFGNRDIVWDLPPRRREGAYEREIRKEITAYTRGGHWEEVEYASRR